MTTRTIKIQPVAPRGINPANVCRNDACPEIGIHPEHPVEVVRGRPPKRCPDCTADIPKGQGAYCTECGWIRCTATENTRAKRKTCVK